MVTINNVSGFRQMWEHVLCKRDCLSKEKIIRRLTASYYLLCLQCCMYPLS